MAPHHLICISLMTNYVKNLFMCLLAIYLWRNVCSILLPIFQSRFFSVELEEALYAKNVICSLISFKIKSMYVFKVIFYF